MNTPLRVLIVEDSEDDTILVVRELRNSGYDPTFERVDTPEAFIAALTKQTWDIVIADYSMPRFSGLAALTLLKESELGLPFIIVSGAIGEDVAVSAMKAGAHDYVMKDNLMRLGPAVQRELHEAKVRLARRRAEEALRESEERHRVLYNIDLAITSILNPDDVMQVVYEQVSGMMSLTTFYIGLCNEERDEIYVPFTVEEGERLPPLTLKVEEKSGLSGWVVRTREPLWIGDMEKERNTLPVKGIVVGIPTRSLMVLPLIARDQVVGVISAQSCEPYAFDEGRQRLFSGIATQVAIAVENARLFEETNRRLAETRLLQEVMQAAASTLDFDEVLTRTIDILHTAWGIEYLNFAFPDESGTALITHPSLIGFAPPDGYYRVPLEGSVMGRVYQTEEPALVPDVREEPYYFEGAPEIRSELAVPVKVAGQVIAVLNAESSHLGAFSEEDQRLFSAVATQLGVALQNARLYQKLEIQTAELSQAYDELQEIDRLRTELVQNVSHELRTPLSVVNGYVELLLRGNWGDLLDDQRDALQITHAHTATLKRLIHNLTVLQAAPRETLTLVPLSVVEVVQHTLAKFRPVAEPMDIVFQDELPATAADLPPVQGNQERLELVFSHLLDNAIKFSPDGGVVTIRAWVEREMVCVSIADQGIGISSEHLPHIFERFYQVDGGVSRRFGGMGVGLALVWEVVKAHGGTVAVESELGQGSTFIVALLQAKGMA